MQGCVFIVLCWRGRGGWHVSLLLTSVLLLLLLLLSARYTGRVRAGVLKDGARDWRVLPRIFSSAGVTPVGLSPNFSKCGGDGRTRNCISNASRMVVYVHPNNDSSATLQLGSGSWSIRCYNPIGGSVVKSLSGTGTVRVSCGLGSNDVVIIAKK